MTFSLDDTKAILRHPAVDGAMKRIVGNRMVAVPKMPTWRFAGQDNPTTPFRLLRECVERAVAESIRDVAPDDRQGLLIVLRMVEGDDIAVVARAVGAAVEDYAVTMQFGPEGLRDYREHLNRTEKSNEQARS